MKIFKRSKNNGNGCFAFFILTIISLVAFLIIGEVKCIVKFVKCYFEPSYKAEAIYGIGTFTGLGAVIGFVNIDDGNKSNKLEQ